MPSIAFNWTDAIMMIINNADNLMYLFLVVVIYIEIDNIRPWLLIDATNPIINGFRPDCTNIAHITVSVEIISSVLIIKRIYLLISFLDNL